MKLKIKLLLFNKILVKKIIRLLKKIAECLFNGIKNQITEKYDFLFLINLGHQKDIHKFKKILKK